MALHVVCQRGLFLLATFALVAGCSEPGPTRVKVSGTVKYSDGSIPTGEVRTIRFEPASLATGAADPKTKAASGTIESDGTFRLSTVDPNDGAFPGDYKVTFTIKQTYSGDNDMLVAPEFMTASTTPLSATVKLGETNKFDFTIEKKK